MSGYLEWSVKLSLLMYVTTAPGGRLETAGVTSERGMFRFPLVQSDEQEYVFGGSVGFFAHHGAPITALGGLRVRRDGDAWQIAYVPPGGGGPLVAWQAAGDAAPTDGVLELAPVVLTEDGAGAFGGYYAAGEAFDPARIVLG